MIPRLRRKFTLINLLLVGMVLTVGLALLLAANARRLENQTYSALEVALELGDGDSPPRLEVGASLPNQESLDEGYSFLIPFFLVSVQEDMATLLISSGQLQVSQETARQAAELAMDSGQEAGVLKELHLRYLIRTQADGSVRRQPAAHLPADLGAGHGRLLLCQSVSGHPGTQARGAGLAAAAAICGRRLP